MNELACLKDTKAGGSLSSRSAWDTRSPSPRYSRNGDFRMGSHPASLACVGDRAKQVSEFFCSDKRKCVLAVS